MERTTLISLWVPGKPEPKGSVQAFVPTYKNGSPVRTPHGAIQVNITDDNKDTRRFMKAIKAEVAANMGAGFERAEGIALEVEIAAFLPRPGGHYGTGRNLRLVKDSSPAYPVVEYSGDVDKLARSVLDALNELVWKTDAAVQRLVIEKHYAVPDEHGDGQGAAIRVFACEVQRAINLPIEQRTRVLHADPADPVEAIFDAGQLALDAA
jgi:Holliday junction resolvase RusA-like endonuclease